MNTFKAKVNKVILALTLVGLLILMIFPGSLSAWHYRYGTMSWKTTDTAREIELNAQIGWTANHNAFRSSDDYGDFVSGYVGSIKGGVGDSTSGEDYYYEIEWGDSSTTGKMDHKIISREGGDRGSDCNSTQCTKSTLSEMGVYDTSATPNWKPGMKHTYSSDGDYVIYWTSQSRASVENDDNGGNWRNETKVNIGGTYAGNNSPVGAVPYVVQVQDNTTFRYQVSALDPDGDTLGYRWGTGAEFFNGSGDFDVPTGMTLSNSGLIEWDVRNSVLADNAGGEEGDLWVAVIMVEDSNSSGDDNKSYIPLDFFFKLASADNDPPTFSVFPTGTQTVVIGDNKTFTIKSRDDRGEPPTVSVLNPPSTDNKSMWDNVTSISADNETTFTIHFAPDSTMDNDTYAVNIRSTDNDSMTYDKTLAIRVTSVSNTDPTAPTLLSPADNSTVTGAVTFQWEKSTDADNDNISYTLYVCVDDGFVGSGLCTGTSVTAGVNFVPPFNQNLHDNLIPWPRALHAATISQRISQDLSMIPKLVILLGVLGLLGVIISLSVKNTTHRRIVFMLFFILIGAVSCSVNYDDIEEDSSASTEITALTLSEVTAVTTPTTNRTPDYTFSSTKAGIITYGGSCTSSITECAIGNNTITLSRLSDGTYDNCTITVTDNSDNSSSSLLTMSTFTVNGTDVIYSTSDLTSDKYYWKVVASDPKGGRGESERWSFNIQ